MRGGLLKPRPWLAGFVELYDLDALGWRELKQRLSELRIDLDVSVCQLQPSVFTRHVQRYFARIFGGPVALEFFERDIVCFQIAHLAALDAVARGIDPKRLLRVGHSQGDDVRLALQVHA